MTNSISHDDLDDMQFEPVDLDALQDVLDLAEEAGVLDYNFSIRIAKAENWDVFDIIATHLDSDEQEGVATIYPSKSESQSYDASKVAEFWTDSVSLLPGLIVHLMDSIDEIEQLSRRRQTATFLAGIIYKQTMDLTNENPELKAAWKPLLKVLNVQAPSMNEYLESLVQPDDTEPVDDAEDGNEGES